MASILLSRRPAPLRRHQPPAGAVVLLGQNTKQPSARCCMLIVRQHPADDLILLVATASRGQRRALRALVASSCLLPLRWVSRALLVAVGVAIDHFDHPQLVIQTPRAQRPLLVASLRKAPRTGGVSAIIRLQRRARHHRRSYHRDWYT